MTIIRSSRTPGHGDVEQLADHVVPERFVPGPKRALPVGTLDQRVDDLGPEVGADRVEMVGSRGVAEDRLAEVVLLAPDFRDAVPEGHAVGVQRVAGWGDRRQIVESPGHHAGVEHAVGVEHRLARVGAGFLKPLADLAESLALAERIPAGQVLDHHDGAERGANVGAVFEQYAGALDRLLGRLDARQPGHRQQEPRAVRVPRVERSSEEDPPPPRAAQEVRQVVTAEIALFRRDDDRRGEHLREHLAGDRVAVRPRGGLCGRFRTTRGDPWRGTAETPWRPSTGEAPRGGAPSLTARWVPGQPAPSRSPGSARLSGRPRSPCATAAGRPGSAGPIA